MTHDITKKLINALGITTLSGIILYGSDNIMDNITTFNYLNYNNKVTLLENKYLFSYTLSLLTQVTGLCYIFNKKI